MHATLNDWMFDAKKFGDARLHGVSGFREIAMGQVYLRDTLQVRVQTREIFGRVVSRRYQKP
jgi:hypothetical protein